MCKLPFLTSVSGAFVAVKIARTWSQMNMNFISHHRFDILNVRVNVNLVLDERQTYLESTEPVRADTRRLLSTTKNNQISRVRLNSTSPFIIRIYVSHRDAYYHRYKR